jgi:hypothetical protein
METEPNGETKKTTENKRNMNKRSQESIQGIPETRVEEFRSVVISNLDKLLEHI